jgi:transcriptional regulator with XRE-family HTH domain
VPTGPRKRRPTPLRVQARQLSKRLSKEFGNALRDARLRARMTQTDVAKRARLGQTYVSRVELGHQNLTLDSMSLLARAAGLSISLVIASEDGNSDDRATAG